MIVTMRKGFLLTAIILGACNGKFGDPGPERDPEPLGPRPDYGPTVKAKVAPPPISGGTLHVTSDARFVVAADPDRDRVSVVDRITQAVSHVAFEAGAEPGRVVEDGAGAIHVVLRGKGEIATLDVTAGASLVRRRAVCPVPRGLAVDGERLLVACAGGELVALPLDPARETTVVTRLKTDLRDVVVTGAAIFVSTFREASVYRIAKASSSEPMLVQLPPRKTLGGAMTAAVAWRMRPEGRGVVVVHQVGADPSATPISTDAGGYSKGDGSSDPDKNCTGSIVQGAVSHVGESGGVTFEPALPRAVLPVDLAIDDRRIVVVAAGNGKTRKLRQLFHFPVGTFNPCVNGDPIADPPGQSVAAAFAQGRLFVQTREPAAIHVYDMDLTAAPVSISLAADSREDTGHTIFHSNSGSFLACASCHPEGGDDGRVWSFAKIGPRRTQSFRGGFLKTAPFHWDGDMPDLRALSEAVLSKRMSGPHLDDPQLGALALWLDAVPALPKPAVTVGSVDAGAALFTARGCGTCHTGAATTSNATVDVGTGGSFQVPSLRGIFYRAPLMHDGCAPTLAARFTSDCAGGDKHGRTRGLTEVEIQNFVAYLSTL